MMRLLFTGLAALAVLGAITLWWRPMVPAPCELVTQPALEAARAALERSPVPAEPAAPSAPTVHPTQPERRPVVAATPEPASRTELPTLLEPQLEEEAPLVLVERPDFEDGAVAARQPLDLDAPASSAAAADAAPARFDVEASGKLIRRMLALYDAMQG